MARTKTPTPTLPDAPKGADVSYEPGAFNPFVHGLLKQASDLRAEREALTERTRANRESLHNVLGTGLLSADQATAIGEWYPKKSATAAEGDGATEEVPADPKDKAPAK